MNKSKNKDRLVVLEYKELHQEDEKHSNYLNSKKGQEEVRKNFVPTFVNYFNDSDTVATTRSEYYHDIVNKEKRPDYRTIEILGLLQSQIEHSSNNKFSIYNGYKVHFPYEGFDIFSCFLFKLGSTIETHLLSFLCDTANEEPYPKISTSYSKLQEFFNETPEAINSGLKNLLFSKLITFSGENGDITIILNKDSILKLTEESEVRYLDQLEIDIKINEYYGEYVCNIFDNLNLDAPGLKKMLEHYEHFREKGLIVIK